MHSVPFVFQAEVMFVAMQRDMLETKAEFKGAQKERNNCQRQKTSVESKIAVSNVTIGTTSVALLVHKLVFTLGCTAEAKGC